MEEIKSDHEQEHDHEHEARALLRRPCHDAMFCPLRADVAQLVEQRFRKPQVTGSNPVVGSSLPFYRGFCVAQLQDYGLAGSRLRLLCVRS